MMPKSTVLALVLVFAGCAGSDDEDRPSSCQRTDRSGTYLAHFETLSGTCGDLPDSVLSLTAPTSNASQQCVREQETWSERDCKLESVTICTTDTGSVRNTMVSRVERAGGAVLTGTATNQISLKDGSGCVGTYRLTMTRQ
jgi:hypothetical protein